MRYFALLLAITITGCGTVKDEATKLRQAHIEERLRRLGELEVAAMAEERKYNDERKAKLRASGYTVCENVGSGIIACK